MTVNEYHREEKVDNIYIKENAEHLHQEESNILKFVNYFIFDESLR